MADLLPAIFGCRGARLTNEERALFAEAQPLGLILFKRNIKSGPQVIELVESFKSLRDSGPILVLIDQEGGRVARLTPPEWPEMASAGCFGRLAKHDMDEAVVGLRQHGALLAAELTALGINVNCAPVLDLGLSGADPIISDRAFGGDPETVSRLGRILAEAMLSGGCLPVMKHIPGHGRAEVDSHEKLPIVTAPRAMLERTDFLPFRKNSDLPLAMTAHIVYKAFDDRLATLSSRVVETVIRDKIGFRGVLLSDDLAMKALSGSMKARAQGALSAGVDVLLHCSGLLEEMAEICMNINAMPENTKAKIERALGTIAHAEAADREALRTAYGAFLARHG